MQKGRMLPCHPIVKLGLRVVKSLDLPAYNKMAKMQRAPMGPVEFESDHSIRLHPWIYNMADPGNPA